MVMCVSFVMRVLIIVTAKVIVVLIMITRFAHVTRGLQGQIVLFVYARLVTPGLLCPIQNILHTNH